MVTPSTACIPPKLLAMSRISTSGVPVRSMLFSAIGSGPRALAVDDVDPDGEDQHDADHDVLVGGVDPDHRHARLQRLHDERAEDGTVDGADTARKRGSPDHGGGDDAKLVERADVVGMERLARRGDDRRDRAEQADDGEDLHDEKLGADPRKLRGLRVAAIGEDVAAESRPLGDDRHGDRDQNEDEHRDRHPVACPEALRHDLAAPFDDAFETAGGYLVGIQDPDEPEDRNDHDAGDGQFRPDRLDGEFVAHLGPARAEQPVERSDDRYRAEDPRPGLAERAVDTAEQLEILVERTDGLPAGDVPGDVAPHEEAT